MYDIIDNVLRPPRRMEISCLLERRRLGTWECTRQAERIERAEGTHDASQSPIDSRQTCIKRIKARAFNCQKSRGWELCLLTVEKITVIMLPEADASLVILSRDYYNTGYQ